MTNSNRLFGNTSTINMATAQRQIFRLLRIYYFPTAHLQIIYLLQIDQIFHHWKSSKYWLLCIENCMTTSNRLFGNISTIYMSTAQKPIFLLLRNIQLFCYSASHYYLSTANRPISSKLEIA